MAIYVDADACPVKDEALRVAERHGLTIYYVSNSWMRLPESPLVQRIVVAEGPDAADDWIADPHRQGRRRYHGRYSAGRTLPQGGAQAIGSTGKPFTDASIGMALAMRELSAHLRETGESKGYNAAFTRQDRSRFLQALEQAVQISRSGLMGDSNLPSQMMNHLRPSRN